MGPMPKVVEIGKKPRRLRDGGFYDEAEIIYWFDEGC